MFTKNPNYKPPRRKRVQVNFKQRSLTDQSFSDSCNINLLVDKHFNIHPDARINNRHDFKNPDNNFKDVSSIPEYSDGMRQITQSKQQFETLPQELREQFDNNPKIFYNEIMNPESKTLRESFGVQLPTDNPIVEQLKLSPDDN